MPATVRPVSAMTTVAPANTTALPAVARARDIDSAGECPSARLRRSPIHPAGLFGGMSATLAMPAAIAGNGFFTTSIPFFRTPKNADNHGFWVAISEAREEVFIMLLLWGAALGIFLVQGLPSNDMRFWVVMLMVQSLPYLAALIMAFTSSLPKPVEAEQEQPAA